MRSAQLTFALVLVFVAGVILPAQSQPPTGAPTQTSAQQTPAAAGQRGGGGGGGGRGGRGAMQIMTLTAPWAPGAEIPAKYAQEGRDVSPALSWDNVPDGAVSFVLIAHDVSAPIGQGTDDLLHWMMWNIPASARSLTEGVPQGSQMADGARQISPTGPYYRGPAAPASGPAHVYLFELYALDAMVNVPALGPAGATVPQIRAAVIDAMAGHVRGKAVTSGVYKRK